MDKLTVSNSATPFERISASYYDDKFELSTKDQELKQRWEAAFSLLLSFHSREQTVKKLRGLFPGISLASAYRDVANALSLFGDIHKAKKEGWRYVIFEYNQTLMQMATKDKNLDIMGRCLDRMIKLADLDKEESNFNPDKLKAMEITISMPPAVQNALKKLVNKGVVDFNNFEVEDIDHEDIKPNEEGSTT